MEAKSDNPEHKLLLLMPATSYRVADFTAAAHQLGVSLFVGTNQHLVINTLGIDNALTIDFSEPDQAVKIIVDNYPYKSFTSIVGVDEETTLVAALASEALGLDSSSSLSIRTCHNKFLFRQKIDQSSLLCPGYRLIDFPEVNDCAQSINYPCVVKPLGLSASRGVIRANNPTEFASASRRIQNLLEKCNDLPSDVRRNFICEDFIPGTEIVLEGLLSAGELTTLALFDKPDLLDGPYFEETLYVTPSRQPQELQQQIIDTVKSACRLLGLEQGPIHVELRINQQGCWLIEMAARSIGGHCSRALAFSGGISLENLILRQALGMLISEYNLTTPASGVMMIPIPNADTGPGKLQKVEGLSAARSIPLITSLSINISIGDEVVPLPEGDRYLGFIFANGPSAEEVEAALRESFSQLIIDIG